MLRCLHNTISYLPSFRVSTSLHHYPTVPLIYITPTSLTLGISYQSSHFEHLPTPTMFLYSFQMRDHFLPRFFRKCYFVYFILMNKYVVTRKSLEFPFKYTPQFIRKLTISESYLSALAHNSAQLCLIVSELCY